MSKIKPTLTIGIPALNEYQNLKRLLLEIKKQNLSNAQKVEVAIMSDGSTDKTKFLEKNRIKPLVKVYASKKRHGKPYQLNKLFKSIDSDYVIVLDADITLAHNQTLANLLSVASKNKKALVSGIALPELPQNFTQKIAYAGVKLWDRVRFSGKHSKLYLCEGSIRCFPRGLYKQLKFPSTSADEAYSYLAAKKLKFGFISAKRAVVRYHLPETIKDYYLQLRRYLNSKSIQEVNFAGQDVRKEYDVHYYEKLNALFKSFEGDPLHTLLYFLFVVLVKVTVHLHPAKYSSRWLILSSTKKV